MIAFTTFITLAVGLLHIQLTQLVSPEVSSDPLASSCVQSSFLKDYLENILRSFRYPEGFHFQEITSSIIITPLSIVGIEVLDTESFSTFAVVRPLIVLDLPDQIVEQAVKKIYREYRRRGIKWQPFISVIWKSPRKKDEQCDSYTNSSMTKVNVWELYAIKQRRFMRIVNYFDKPTLAEKAANLSVNVLNEGLEGFARRRHNFHLERLSVSVTYDDKYQDDWVGLRKSKGSYSVTGGYVAFIYWDLKILMNFSDHILLGDSPKVFANGTLGGKTVHQLTSDEIDLTLNQISFSLQRAKALTFLQPTYYSLTYAFFKQPSTNSLRNIVIAAFQKELWVALIGVWAILVISTKVRLLLVCKIIAFSLLGSCTRKVDLKFSNESVLWSVAVFCQKAWYFNPYSTSLRMKFMIGSILGFLTYTAYSGSIVSSLAVNKIPIKNFIDLINFNFRFTVHEQSGTFQFMLEGLIKSYALTQSVATTSTAKEVSHLFLGYSNSVRSVQSATVAFLSPADMFYKTAKILNYTDSFVCDHVTPITTGVYPIKSGMLVKKGSQYKEVLNYMLIYLRQRGLISRNIERYNTQSFLKCMPIEEQDSKVDPATWRDVFTIIVILFSGLVFATLMLSLEIAYACYSDRKPSLSDLHTDGHYFVVYETVHTYYMV